MNDLLKIFAGGFLLYHLFPRRKLVNDTEPDLSVLDREPEADLMDQDFICTDFGIEQTKNFKQNFEIARSLDQAESITLLLKNQSIDETTTEIFNSEEAMAGKGSGTGQSILELIDFKQGVSGWPYVDLSGPPYVDMEGSKRVIFMCYLDTDDGFSPGGNFAFSLGDNVADCLNAAFREKYLFISPSDDNNNVISVDITGLEKRLLIISIEKELNTGKGKITNVLINNQSQALTNPGGYNACTGSGDMIGSLDGTQGFMKLGVLWNFFVHDLDPDPDVATAYWKGQPNGSTALSWHNLVDGIINGSPKNSPSERDILIGYIETSAPGITTYREINLDFSTNPITVFHIKVIVQSNAQLLKQLNVKNEVIIGDNYNQIIHPQNFKGADTRILMVDIPLKKTLIIDNNTKIEYALGGSEVVTLVFYYQQIDLSKLDIDDPKDIIEIDPGFVDPFDPGPDPGIPLMPTGFEMPSPDPGILVMPAGYEAPLQPNPATGPIIGPRFDVQVD